MSSSRDASESTVSCLPVETGAAQPPDGHPTSGGDLGCVEHSCLVALGTSIDPGDSDGCANGQLLRPHTDPSCTVKCAEGYAPQGIVASDATPQKWIEARENPTPIQCLARSDFVPNATTPHAPTSGGVICRLIHPGSCQPGSCATECHGEASDASQTCDIAANADGTVECPRGCMRDSGTSSGGHICANVASSADGTAQHVCKDLCRP
eukprot:COSAG02_NODE_22874_length_737_cov_1.208464_1_plen_208_part_01